jgi:hypothetical protein
VALADGSVLSRVLSRLREYATYYRAREQHGGAVAAHSVPGLAQELTPADAYEVWLVIHDLARMGVLIPGLRNYMRFSGDQLRKDGQSEIFNCPYFTITPFGLEYLESSDTS